MCLPYQYAQLKTIAKNLHEQYKTTEHESQLLQEEYQKLKEDNQSLETIRKIQEKDAATEKSALESLVSLIDLCLIGKSKILCRINVV